VGCAAATVIRNDGTLERIIARGSTFSENTDPGVTLWTEASLTGENGYAIIKTCLGIRNICYMSRQGAVGMVHPSDVLLDATTCPGMYIIITQSGRGCPPSESLLHHQEERKSRVRPQPVMDLTREQAPDMHTER
jgi:hypothetical protein